MESFDISGAHDDAEAPLRALHDLAERAIDPQWSRRDPHTDLLPRLRVACDLPGSPWRLIGTDILAGRIYAIDVVHTHPRSARLLADAIALLAAVAGPAFFVRHTDAATIDCVTGTLERDSPEPAHGYTLRLRLTDPTSFPRHRIAAVRLAAPVPAH
ncbi:hypothetical protein [Embleya sp. NBC_00896]|uniref:hypothetical protein n=1 Tax=Embleya sp. NBC_00896 TaxID=2975961 RepID=UPI002F91AAA3|nr:hypothetical protein OG928_37085 [Embleya sp. NBC_00896]